MNTRASRTVTCATAACALLVLALGACEAEPRMTERRQLIAGGDADRGEAAFTRYGCTACHTIPGVRAARGTVGPPLAAWSQRRLIAGKTSNTPDMLVQFIKDPQSISPGSGMPNVGVDDADARHMAAYLYGLR